MNENNQNNHYRFSDQRQAMKTVKFVKRNESFNLKIYLQTGNPKHEIYSLKHVLNYDLVFMDYVQ